MLPIRVVLALAALAIALAVFAVARPGRGIGVGTRVALGALRLGTVSLLAWCLCRPVLVVAESVAQRNVVAVLVDDSRSMRIADVNGSPRAAVVRALAGGADSSLLRALAVRDQVRVYRTSGAGRVPVATRNPRPSGCGYRRRKPAPGCSRCGCQCSRAN